MKLSDKERQDFRAAVMEAVEELGLEVIKTEEFFGMNQKCAEEQQLKAA